MTISVVLGLLIAATGALGDSQTSCAVLEQGFSNELSVSRMTMEPESARARIFDEATAASKRCRESEGIAYVRVRAIELGTRVQSQGQAPDSKGLELVREISKGFPKSARIATVRARLEGTTDFARIATSLDPSYGPAQVVLAFTLLSSGDVSGARAAIDRVNDLSGLDDGYAVLARIKWAQGDLSGAKQAANLELNGGRRAHGIEPGGDGAKAQAQAHETLALAYIKEHRANQAVPHLMNADPESKQVRSLLEHPDAALRKAIARYKARGKSTKD